MSSFSQMTPRLFGFEPFMGSTPIYPLNDPWLGVGIQLLPLPGALLRVLIMVLPSFCLSVYSTSFIASLVTHQDEYSYISNFYKLWFNSATFMAAIKSSERKNISDEREKYRLYQDQTNLIITLKQGTKMKRRFQRQASKIGLSLVGQWPKFLKGRNRIVIDDVRSELTSDSDSKTTRGHIYASRLAHGPNEDTLDQRLFLFAEIESRRNAVKNRDEMMAMLEPDWQARRAKPAVVSTNRKVNLENSRCNAAPTAREQFRSNGGRIVRRSDVKGRSRDDLGDRLQAQLLNIDAFPPMETPITVDGRNKSAGFMTDVMFMSDPSSSSSLHF